MFFTCRNAPDSVSLENVMHDEIIDCRVSLSLSSHNSYIYTGNDFVFSLIEWTNVITSVTLCWVTPLINIKQITELYLCLSELQPVGNRVTQYFTHTYTLCSLYRLSIWSVMTYCRILPSCHMISLQNLCISWTEVQSIP